MAESIRVDVWSDVACPWCYIGKRRFEQAVEQFTADHPDVDVEVTFHSFELMPDTPEDVEGTIVEYLQRSKGWSPDQIRGMHEYIAGLAAEVGLHYDFASQQPANTRKAHQVLHLARERGRQAEVKERLLSAHFVEGRHVGHDEELADLAAEAGLDRDEVLRVLHERTHADAVDADIDHARRLGISGVPFFVLDGRYGISGAQPADLFLQALTQVLDEREPASPR